MIESKKPLKIALVDDHLLLRKGLANIIRSFDKRYIIETEGHNGQMILATFKSGKIPHIAVVDVNMPLMDGFELTKAIKTKYPSVKVLALTMLKDEETIIKLLKAGVDGYLNKDAEPQELHKAIRSIEENGNYYTEVVTGNMLKVLRGEYKNSQNNPLNLTEREQEFLEWACTDYTYQMIADKMCLSIKTIDGYRAKLFEKFDLKSRVALVVFAHNNNLVSLGDLPA